MKVLNHYINELQTSWAKWSVNMVIRRTLHKPRECELESSPLHHELACEYYQITTK